MRNQPKQPDAPAPKGPPPQDQKPRPGEREVEVEEIELDRAVREANRPSPGTLGGDFKP